MVGVLLNDYFVHYPHKISSQNVSSFQNEFRMTKLRTRPRGLMDKASDFESEDCEFESRRGRKYFRNNSSRIWKLHKSPLFISQLRCLVSYMFQFEEVMTCFELSRNDICNPKLVKTRLIMLCNVGHLQAIERRCVYEFLDMRVLVRPNWYDREQNVNTSNSWCMAFK